jgi:hypothetical protein
MRDEATISGNTATGAATSLAGGVLVYNGGFFNMEGGRIYGNTRGANVPADVVSASTGVSLYGTASIGRLILGGTAAYVTIRDGWTGGTVYHIDLRVNNGNINTVVGNWTNAANNMVLRTAESQNLPANVLDRVGSDSARFIGNGEGVTQLISPTMPPTHEIAIVDGAGVVRAIAAN